MRAWKFKVVRGDDVGIYLVKSVGFWTALRNLGWKIQNEKPKGKRLLKKNSTIEITLIGNKKTGNLYRVKLGRKTPYGQERYYSAYAKDFKVVERLKMKAKVNVKPERKWVVSILKRLDVCDITLRKHRNHKCKYLDCWLNN